MRAAILFLALLFAHVACAGPQVISGTESCPNCGDRNTDFLRYRNEAYNCVMGSYQSTVCTQAHQTFGNQYDVSLEKGVRVKICSTLTDQNYGCQNVDLYWDFADPPLSVNDAIAWWESVLNDFHFHDLIPPFIVVRGVNVRMVTPDGQHHDTYYYLYDFPDDSNIPTYPPDLPYPPGHPLGNPVCHGQHGLDPVPALTALYPGGQALDLGDEGAPLLPSAMSEDGMVVAGDRVELVGGVLQIRHQRRHPDNDRYAPLPLARLRSVPLPDADVSGFAALRFGASGRALGTSVYATRGEVTSALEQALAQAASTQAPDERRHDHTLYFAFRTQDGMLVPEGLGFVTQPQCCGRPCPPPPNQCQ
jgi:hypothetical protein